MKKPVFLLVLMFCVLISVSISANITMWTTYAQHLPEYEALMEIVNGYENASGNKVTVSIIPDLTDLDTKLRVAAPSGVGPDIICTAPHDSIGKWAEQRILKPLETIMMTELEGFFPSTIQAVTYEGHVYGLPYSVESVGLVYNTDLVPEAPETFEDIVEICKDMNSKGKYGLVFPAAEPYHMYSVLRGFGGYIFGWKDNSYDINDIGIGNEGAIKAVEYLKSMLDDGLIPAECFDRVSQHQFSTGTFEEGKAALQINGPWVSNGLKDAGINFSVALIPVLPNGNYGSPFLGVQYIGLSNFGRNQKDALELAKEFINKDNMTAFALKTGRAPTRFEVLESAEIQEDEIIKAWSEQAKYGEPMPNIPEMGTVWTAWTDALPLIYSGKQTAENTMEELADIIKNKILLMRK